MFESGKETSLSKYKNIIGSAKETIEAIQKYINNFSSSNINNNIETEEEPAASINRILNSTACEETNLEIQKIINNL